MRRRRDPVQQRDDGSLDLHDVVEWSPKTFVDRAVFRLYGLILSTFRAVLVIVGLLILLSQFALGGLGALTDPVLGGFVALSAIPALLLAAYVWRADVTAREPLRLLVVTFVLGVLFAGFALVLNELFLSLFGGVLVGMGVVSADATSLPPLVLAVFFLVGIGPIEEGVKLLAVRLYAYRKPQFDAVIDGAVYGAAAALGFATIENALYISDFVDASLGTALADSTAIATRRALAGPGHVIYSAFAGYYLGLAKFNRRYAGPIVLKGLLIAALIHGGYNIFVSIVPTYISEAFDVAPMTALFIYVILYNGIFGALLVRKLSRYRSVYHQARAGSQQYIPSERTEFE